MAELMCRSQLLFFPSIREFGGGVVLEAMALGLVPVVVDYAGPGELVVDGTGIKVPLGRREEIVASLHEAVKAICDRPEQIEIMSKRARKHIASYFTWDAKASQVMQVYDWVLGRKNERPDVFSAIEHSQFA